MTRQQARELLGNRAKWELQGMARALQLHPWKNTREQWRTLKALRALGYKIKTPLPD
jgi:hypothetical protein